MAKVKSEEFPHDVRIVRSSDYRRLYKEGKKVHSERFVLFGLENEIGHHRLGITVSRKVGCAVVRNRVKRLLREIFRRSRCRIPGGMDMVINAKAPCAGARYEELWNEFQAAIEKIRR